MHEKWILCWKTCWDGLYPLLYPLWLPRMMWPSTFSNKWSLFLATANFQQTLEEIVSKSTLLATRPSRLAPKKCINKSIWLATGGAPSMGTPRVPSGCQPNWFVYAFSWVRSPKRRVDLDTISSSETQWDEQLMTLYPLGSSSNGDWFI
jgi:hypothetical protein